MFKSERPEDVDRPQGEHQVLCGESFRLINNAGVKVKNHIILVSLLICFGCAEKSEIPNLPLTRIANGWKVSLIAEIDQSYAGWDVEIGDVDNDGANEILVTGCPDSRLYLLKLVNGQWNSRLLAENLAESRPGMGLTVRVVDLNADGSNELILGTGQETGGTAFFYLMETDGHKITRKLVSRPEFNSSSYTHNFAVHDLDKDGTQEVIAAYCGGGEIIRYDFDPALSVIEAQKIYQLTGSGEESMIADVDNDARVEYLASNSFRRGDAKVEIFEFDSNGGLITPARLVIGGYDDKKCFYASLIAGDVDNDGSNELIIGWKQDQRINKGTVLGYRITDRAEIVYNFAYEDEDLDMAYFEKMMAVADADNDGKNELVISTRGDNMSEKISSRHLGYLFEYRIGAGNQIQKTLLADLDSLKAASSWLAVGDADNDGRNEVVLATGKGDRTKKGTSYVLLLSRND
jgi:hypothetical protein